MARLQPTSLNEMLGVKGMGVMKASQYGDAFLQTLRAWKAQHPAAPRPGMVQTTAMRREAYRDALMQGLTPEHPWSREEDERLRRGYLAGVTVKQLWRHPSAEGRRYPRPAQIPGPGDIKSHLKTGGGNLCKRQS